MRTLSTIAVFILASGCGTLRNVVPQPASTPQHAFPARKIVYGGVKDDVARVNAAVKDLNRFPESNNRVTINLGSATLHAMDAPGSLLGDTLTLPVTIPASIDRAVADYYFPDDNEGLRETEVADDETGPK